MRQIAPLNAASQVRRYLKLVCWLLVVLGPCCFGSGVRQATAATDDAAANPAPAAATKTSEGKNPKPDAKHDKIAKIRVIGQQRIEAATVLTYLDLQPGDEFDQHVIDRSLKKLFDTGLFADVDLVREGNDLVVKLVENPIINRILFDGNSKLETDKLKQELQLRERAIYTKSKVQADLERLQEIYRRTGRFDAEIVPKIVTLPQNRVDLVFEIKENKATLIGGIRFIGNNRFNSSILRSIIQTRESRWWKLLATEDNYDPDRVNYDRDLLRRFYLRNGFADFRILSSAVELSPDRSRFYITFTIEEGERYKVAAVTIDSAIKELTPDNMMPFVRTQAGDWYDAAAVDDSVEGLTRQAGTLGYAFTIIEPNIDRDRAHHTLAIKYSIKPGPKVYVERINITGNVRTFDYVIRREFRLAEGDAFNGTLLKRSEQRIKDLGYFAKVEVTNRPGSAPDLTIIEARVIEQSTGTLNFGGGYATNNGLFLQTGMTERNFGGTGQTVNVNAQLSAVNQQYDLSYTEPYFLGRDLSLSVNVFRIVQTVDTNQSYAQNTNGLTIGTAYSLSEEVRHAIRFTRKSDQISNVQSTASTYILQQKGTAQSAILGQDITWTRLDSNISPTSGLYVSVGADYAGLGANINYLRSRFKTGGYYPILPRLIGNLRMEAGNIFGLSNQLVRINDRFFLGGDNFRGFAVGGAGPRDSCSGDVLGANRYWVGTAELQFPLTSSDELGLSGRVFNDVGTSSGLNLNPAATPTAGCANNNSVVQSPAIRDSIGFGFTIISPLGPIRLDFATPLLRQPSDATQSVLFSFGQKF
ncbi:MAG: outer membrane protein assembly factor BamA [Candidatus Symbiobacter sp.]|nr:outer membrane protein assembly factor BamA [Candidatus Symbiobacter sp.]